MKNKLLKMLSTLLFVALLFTVATQVTAADANVPKLSAIYNSANGADIRFRPVEGASQYIIERKENGTWSDVITVDASKMEKAGSDLKYIDTSIKGEKYYGKGYIYSVAAIINGKKTAYDTKGLALYRLEKPSISSVSIEKSGKCNASWGKVDAHGYELQYSSDEGKTWNKLPETKNLTISFSGLDVNASYVFRLRTYKDNSDRGRTYSQYSDWAKPFKVEIPKLMAIYNSANGADIRWKADNSSSYVIMRKENGVWKEIKTVSASSLSKDGGNYKYIDGDIKTKYGKGYIYSVAVKDSSGNLYYDTKGLALYRLQAPSINYVVYREEKNYSDSYCYLTWTEVAGADSYEVQFAPRTDTSKWMTLGSTTDTVFYLNDIPSTGSDYYKDVSGNYYWFSADYELVDYCFRIRCSKTNSDRGTTFSQYSSWGKYDTYHAAGNSDWSVARTGDGFIASVSSFNMGSDRIEIEVDICNLTGYDYTVSCWACINGEYLYLDGEVDFSSGDESGLITTIYYSYIQDELGISKNQIKQIEFDYYGFETDYSSKGYISWEYCPYFVE